MLGARADRTGAGKGQLSLENGFQRSAPRAWRADLEPARVGGVAVRSLGVAGGTSHQSPRTWRSMVPCQRLENAAVADSSFIIYAAMIDVKPFRGAFRGRGDLETPLDGRDEYARQRMVMPLLLPSIPGSCPAPRRSGHSPARQCTTPSPLSASL